jgi:hypothetical protein
MTTQDAVQGSSVQVGSTPPSPTTISTGTSGGSAGNDNTTTGGTGPMTSSTPVVAPKGFRSEMQQLLQGWQEVIPSDSTFPSSAGSYNQAAVLAKLQGYLGAYADLDTHVMGTKEARAQVESQLSEAQTYCSALKAAVISYFGAQSPQLAKFGFKARKVRAPLTGQQLAVRAAKVRATRKLRGTMGSAQKAAIKSGPMTFVEPVASAEQQSGPAATAAVATAPPGSAGA